MRIQDFYQSIRVIKIKKEEIREAMRIVGLDPDSKKHVGKYSLGMRQRLGIAQAIMEDPDILLLDEPTAALDPIAESNIYEKYNQLSAHKTSIFISHRLASTRFCDRIFLMEDGRIAEEGTHEELLKKAGSYAKMFEVQRQYYV